MAREIVDRIEVLDSGGLFLGLQGAGQPAYEHVHRAAGGVYWDASRGGFRSTPIREWTAAQWFSHMASIVRAELGVELVLAGDVAWGNVSDEVQRELRRAAGSA